MRVLTVIDAIGPPAARGTDAIYRLQCELSKSGIKVHILTLIDFLMPSNWKAWMKKEEKEKSIHFHYIDLSFFRKSKRLGTPSSRIAYFFKVMNLQRRYRFDIIHEYSTAPILFYRTALYKLFFKVKVFHTLCGHNLSFWASYRCSGGIKYLNRVISLSRDMRDRLTRETKYGNRISYFPFGVDHDIFNKTFDIQKIKEDFKIPKNKKIVLYVGPIERHKGIFVLAEAATKVLKEKNNVVFVFVSWRRRPEKEHRINKKHFMEIISKVKENIFVLERIMDVSSMMAMADVIVFPQITTHGIAAQPLTLLEAMASGKAIVASDVAGIKELIRDGVNGILFKAGNNEELIKALERLIGSESLRERLAKAAKRKITKDYDISTISKRLKNLYLEALEE